MIFVFYVFSLWLYVKKKLRNFIIDIANQYKHFPFSKQDVDVVEPYLKFPPRHQYVNHINSFLTVQPLNADEYSY